ncbi:MAG TPA: HAD family hydrolase [Bryobacteraceae bacterium]|nr:HAD family hydrolase [Bryobacteraceae bacterium]
MKRAVFLDRDGVLNRQMVRDGVPYPPSVLEDVVIPPGTKAALERLKDEGFALIGVTNQPDVRRGNTSVAVVEQVHRYLTKSLPLDDIFVCYHDDDDHCECRKPMPGLILQAAQRYCVNLPQSFMVGDRWRDVDAGAAAGCKTVLIDYGYTERPPKHRPNASVTSLQQAVDWILCRENSSVHSF